MRRGAGATVAALLVALVATLTPTARSQDEPAPRALTVAEIAELDDAVVHGTITPPGAGLLEKEAELRAYDELVYGYPTLTEAELTTKYFKDGRWDPVTDPARDYRPRADVRIVRDRRWGVPHIYGDTDAAAAFGAGYAAVEDRLPIILLLIALGRAEAFDLLGTAESWLADAELVRLYGYTEDELEAMIDRLPAVYGQDGADVVALLEELVQGMNHALLDVASGLLELPVALGDLGLDLPGPFKMTDIVAIVATVRALFGAGGGGEMGNAARWARLVDAFGPERARLVWDDFRNQLNDDGLVHTTDPFPYLQRPAVVDERAHPGPFTPGQTGLEGVLDDVLGFVTDDLVGQLGDLAAQARIRTENLRLETPLGTIDLSHPGSMSNHLVVDGTLSSTGHPILLGGPQAGYFDPQILVENEIHGDRLHARGASFPGMGFVVIGRNAEAAWTATAGGSDMIDTYVEVLCEPDGSTPTEQSRHYRFEGECRPMDRPVQRLVDTLVPIDLPGRELLPDIVAERTVHGPVVARGRVGDTPVAVTRKRSTYGKELDAAISILRLNRNEIHDGQAFVDAFEDSHNLSTNWSFVNADEIAYVHGGLYPVRPPDIDPDFPVWGTGEWEWARNPDGTDRYLAEHPHEIAPDRHYIVSWNNRPAPGWGAADSNWGFSGIYRADLLEDPIRAAAPGSITPVRLVQIMEQAGLTDLRGSHVLPLALRVLDATPPSSPRAALMRTLLGEWVTAGALRRDGNRDGRYDHGAAVAVMDAWWVALIRAVYDPVVGDVGGVSAQGFHNAPGSGGSAFQGGFYGQVWTDLSMVLGDPVASPTSQTYCGSNGLGIDGTLEECSRRLWATLEHAGAVLGGTDPAAWDANAQQERIVFVPTVALSMHWVNRPTTQVLAMFGRHADDAAATAGGDGAGAAPSGSLPALPATGPSGSSTALPWLGAFAAAVALALARWRRWPTRTG